jgi:hypothetical protein
VSGAGLFSGGCWAVARFGPRVRPSWLLPFPLLFFVLFSFLLFSDFQFLILKKLHLFVLNNFKTAHF